MTPLEIKYQREVIDGIAGILGRRKPYALSLVAPTGSGKTFMLAHGLDEGCGGTAPKTVWLWLAPFEVIVSQTRATIHSEARRLVTRSLETERRATGFRDGEVYIATSQLVANPNTSVHEATERTPTLAQMVAQLKDQRFRFGVVLDEAHIGVDAGTELGRRIAALAPDIVIAASATPRDERLAGLLVAAKVPPPRTVTVSRHEVVEAGLNKPSLFAVRLLPGAADDAMARELGLRAMIHQAVACRNRVEAACTRNGSAMVPLLLAQADNGEASAQRIEKALIESGMPTTAIRRYLDNDRSGGALATIAADPAVKALIFKVAAGTGFDAPRACVLASDRAVQDQDAAIQFVGRIMRVPAEVRDVLRAGAATAEETQLLSTAFLFTCDAGGQEAFRSAATLLRALSTELDFAEQDIHVLDAYQPAPVQPAPPQRSGTAPSSTDGEAAGQEDWGHHPGPLFALGDGDDARISFPGISFRPAPGFEGDEQRGAGQVPGAPRRPRSIGPRLSGYGNLEEVKSDLQRQGLQAWQLRTEAGQPRSFWQEDWPLLEDHARFMDRLVKSYVPTQAEVERLVPIARGDWRATAEVENLFRDGDIQHQSLKVRDPRAIARLAEAAARGHLDSLRTLSDSGAQDEILVAIRRTLVRVLAQAGVKLTNHELSVMSRLAVPGAMPGFRKEEAEFLSRDVRVAPGDRVPDLLVLPARLNRKASRRAIYGAIPPTKDELQEAAPGSAAAMSAWAGAEITVCGETLTVEKIDQSIAINETEAILVGMLERIDGVRWWGRNPDQKRWSARLLRIDGKGRFFYPDFVVNVSARPAAEMQLIETKHDAVDIEAKRRRGFTPSYGRVLFLYSDSRTLSIVDEDGNHGRPIPTDDQYQLLAALKAAAEPSPAP